MTPAERPPEPVEPTADSSTLADPELSEQEAAVLQYVAKRHARREQRRRKRRIVVGTLVVGACLLTAGLFWSRHQRPPIPTEIDRDAFLKGLQIVQNIVEPRQTLPMLANGPDASPPAVTPPAATAPAPRVPDVSYQPSERLESVQPPAATALARRVPDVSYQPSERLETVHAGDAKETVFELFGTRVERRSGSLVQVEGMRLRASGRSAQHALVEVAEVRITDAVATGSLYWFLFGDGRLIAWGRAKEWPVAAARYQVEIEYQPDRS